MFIGIFIFCNCVLCSVLFFWVGLGYPLEDFYFEPEILESVKKSQDETSRRIMHRAKHLCDQKHVKKNRERILYMECMPTIMNLLLYWTSSNNTDHVWRKLI